MALYFKVPTNQAMESPSETGETAAPGAATFSHTTTTNTTINPSSPVQSSQSCPVQCIPPAAQSWNCIVWFGPKFYFCFRFLHDEFTTLEVGVGSAGP